MRAFTQHSAARKELEHRSGFFSGFGMGLITKLAPTMIPVGTRRNGATYSRNINYDSRTIASRLGAVPVADNAVGAVKIADFESGESWSGGEVWTTNFIQHEAEADGVRSRRGERTAPGTTVHELTGLSLSLGNDDQESIHLWVYGKQIDTTVTTWSLSARVMTDDSNYFEKEIVAQDSQEVIDGDFGEGIGLYFRSKKYEWTKTGSPDWTNITKLQLRLIYGTGTGTFSLVFDNWFEAPARVYALFQYRRQFDPQGRATAKDEYAIARSTLYKFDRDNMRWVAVAMASNVTLQDGQFWSIATLTDRLYACDSQSQFKLMPDGTPYAIGIESPPEGTFTATPVLSGGNLEDGDYWIIVKYYSTTTGIESGADDRAEGKKVNITGGSGNGSISIANLAVSTDPQTTHVRIGIRSASDIVFRRSSADLDGEVANGVKTFTITLAPSDWGDEMGLETDPIPLCKLFLSYDNFLAFVEAAEPSVLGYSILNFPENQDRSNRVRVGEDDNDTITALASFRGFIFTFKNDAIIYGASAAGGTILLRDSISDRGSDAFRSIVVAQDQMFWKSEDGIYRMGPALRPRKMTELNHRGPVQNEDNWDARIDPVYANSACAFQSRSRHQYHLFFRSIGSYWNDLDWVIHIPRMITSDSGIPDISSPYAGTTFHTHAADCATEVEGTTDLQELWIANQYGVVMKIDQDEIFKDDGRSYEARHRQGVWSPFGSERNYRFYGIRVDGEAGGGNLNVNYKIGFEPDPPIADTLSMQGKAAVLGSFILGTSLLGKGQGFTDFLRFQKNRGRRLEVGFWTKGAFFQVYSYFVYFDTMGWR
jgi:hypothetical protein